MEELEVIEKVEEHTNWVNSVVTIVKPNGNLRICRDPRDLNKVIKCEPYPMSTVDHYNAKCQSIFRSWCQLWILASEARPCNQGRTKKISRLLTYLGKFILNLRIPCSFTTSNPPGEGYRMAVAHRTTEEFYTAERVDNQSTYSEIFQLQETS